jgi:hypothetical protein
VKFFFARLWFQVLRLFGLAGSAHGGGEVPPAKELK